MGTVIVFIIILGLAGIPMFISFFDEERKSARREQERKTARTVQVARRAHQV